jgi:hypothetical protein
MPRRSSVRHAYAKRAKLVSRAQPFQEISFAFIGLRDFFARLIGFNPFNRFRTLAPRTILGKMRQPLGVRIQTQLAVMGNGFFEWRSAAMD